MRDNTDSFLQHSGLLLVQMRHYFYIKIKHFNNQNTN